MVGLRLTLVVVHFLAHQKQHFAAISFNITYKDIVVSGEHHIDACLCGGCNNLIVIALAI